MARVIGILAILLLTAIAAAHDTSISGLKIILDKDGAVVSVNTHLSNFGKQNIRDAFPKAIRLAVNGRLWTCDLAEIIEDKPTDTVTLQARIKEPVTGIEVLDRLFPTNPNSKTIAIVMKEGESVGEGVLTSATPTWTYGKVTQLSSFQVFRDFLLMGIEHILAGPDHLLFIFGLMLARPKVKELLKVVTGFTVAHSITLSLCALNIFTLPSKVVEPLIALSIVAVAAESFLKPNEKTWRTVLIAFVFGLIHGFGFAGALTEAGLPTHQAALSLFSFNVGVEVVQAGLILIGIPILLWFKAKKPKIYQPVTIACAVCISLAGLFWFGQRIISG
jgi:hydrogenase/urease accessory protein HupE